MEESNILGRCVRLQWNKIKFWSCKICYCQIKKISMWNKTHCQPITNMDIALSSNPADTWRNNDVVITSKRRHFVVITSKWRRFDFITTLLLRHVFSGKKQSDETKSHWADLTFPSVRKSNTRKWFGHYFNFLLICNFGLAKQTCILISMG